MYSKIVQVYRFGVKRSERDLLDDPGRLGVLSLVHHDHHPVLILAERGNNRGDNKLLPYLYEPKCVGWHSDGMVWRGFQKPKMKNEVEEAPAFLQEWRVTLIEP